MSKSKEFQGKTLDEAIETACDFYNLQRSRLEIEIISGGSTGIFGLMGKKSATIRARPRPEITSAFEGEEEPKEEARTDETSLPATYTPQAEAVEESVDEEVVDEDGPQPGNRLDEPAPEGAPETVAKPPREKKPPRPRGRGPRKQDAENKDDDRRQKASGNGDTPPEREPRKESTVDTEELKSATRETLLKLLAPIVSEPPLSFSMEGDRLDVFIEDEEHSGLIIGREGQTLSSLQYLVNRIVSRRLGGPVRIQIDTGDYRERQNEGLRRLAHQLADKAKQHGKPQSTRPLSSYHRRVVHMALQEDAQISTRSKGEGPMKKVLILPKRGRNRQERRQQ